MLNTGRAYLNVIICFSCLCGFILSNKYVLTRLHFNYPTVFQGWQTLFALLFIRLVVCVRPQHSPRPLDRTAFITLLPILLFFTGSLVASSIALAEIPVLVFVSVQNAIPSLLFVLDNGPRFGAVPPLRVLACVVQLGTVVAIILLDLRMTFKDSPYFWLLTHVLCASVHLVHSRVADSRYSDLDRLYYSYLIGVITLAPASLYLEEAFLVLHFPYKSQTDFIIGCLFAGMFGVLSAIFAVHLRHWGTESCTVVARAAAGVASVWLLDGGTPPSAAICALIAVNFVCSLLVSHQWSAGSVVLDDRSHGLPYHVNSMAQSNMCRHSSDSPDKQTLLSVESSAVDEDSEL